MSGDGLLPRIDGAHRAIATNERVKPTDIFKHPHKDQKFLVNQVMETLRHKKPLRGTDTEFKTYSRQVLMARKIGDQKMWLLSHLSLANYYEEVEEGTLAFDHLQIAFDCIEYLRGNLSRMSLADITPMIRILEQTNRVSEVREMYAAILKHKIDMIGNKHISNLPFAYGLYDASLRLGNLGAAQVEQQTVQRIRESNLPETINWYHPPQGEHRIVKNIEFLASSVDLGRLHLLKKDYEAAKAELTNVTEWREFLRKVGKDWRRRDASVPEQVRSLEIIADGVFRLGEAYVGLGRFLTGENRMVEGIAHWEELIELQEKHNYKRTVTHVEEECVNYRGFYSACLIYVNFLLDKYRYSDALPWVCKAIEQMEKARLRAYSPLYVRTLQQRAQIQLDCHHIPEAIQDFDLCIGYNTKLFTADSMEVAACLSDKSRYIQYITEPTKYEFAEALDLATRGLAMMERKVDKNSPRLLTSLRVLGCLLVRFKRLDQGIALLERYQKISKQHPLADRSVQDRMFALESLAEGYTNLSNAIKFKDKAHKALRQCMVIVLEEEMRGKKNEIDCARIRAKLNKLTDNVPIPLLERYVHPYLRFCANCGTQETHPDQYHQWMSGGVIRLCTIECHTQFLKYLKTNPWLLESSKAAAGPLDDELVLRFMLNLPERPYWFRLAQTCTRLWKLVSLYRTSIRMPGIHGVKTENYVKTYKNIGQETIARLVSRSPRLLHLDFSDSTVVDDTVLHCIGESCSLLKTLSLRASHHITDYGLEEISGCPQLERLDLTHCLHISDEGIISLTRSLPRLQYVSIAHCPEITESGLERLATSCRNLIYLDISYCQRITDRGLKAVMKYCKGLQYLNVRGVNNLSSAELKRTLRLVPHVEGIPWQDIVAADIVSTKDFTYD